jgi:hypothetical protein
MPIPLWLILFVVAGFLLFFFKIAGDPTGQRKSSSLRLFFFLTFVLFALAGIAAFVKWASGME